MLPNIISPHSEFSMKQKTFLLGFITTILFSMSIHASGIHFAEASEKHRLQAVETAFKKHKNIAIVYSQGLVCPSCAIGIKIKLRKLPFTDLKSLKKGVLLDAKHQLAILAIKEGAIVDHNALAKAIDAAGYTPKKVYLYDKGQIKTILINNDLKN